MVFTGGRTFYCLKSGIPLNTLLDGEDWLTFLSLEFAMKDVTWRGTWNGRAPDGLAHDRARTIVRPTGGILRGKFPSRKTGRMVHHEGMLELDAIYHFETSPLIAYYTEQPQTVQYADGGRLRRYTPDFEIGLLNGESVLIEIKPEKFANEPDTRHKLEKVGQHFARHDQKFLVITDKALQAGPRVESLRKIYHLAPRRSLNRLYCLTKLQSLQPVFPIPVAEAVTILRQAGLDPYSLLMAGLATCDLSEPFGDTSILKLTKEESHAWFRLSDRFEF